jgi:predicted aminopeptidase
MNIRRLTSDRRMFWKILTISLALTLSGCTELAYYRQAAAGQWALWQARQPVAEVAADPATSAALRQRLEIAQAIRAFASAELGLPDNGSYQHYADLQRPWVVKNVFAAPELSLEPRQWCFLVVGCLSYRGYFNPEAAQQLAEALQASGDDTYVADISAYSTLGWFDDPLLNTFIYWPDGRLAELIFHELAHQQLYIAHDTAFNEAYATAVGQLGAERWLERQGSARARDEYVVDMQRREQFLQLTAEAREQLAIVYASPWSETEKRAGKQHIFKELRERYQALKQRWGGYAGYDRWFAHDLNNAKLSGVSTYHRQVPAFLALFERGGRDFAAFHRAVEAIGRLPPAERAMWLRQLRDSQDLCSEQCLARSGRPES